LTGETAVYRHTATALFAALALAPAAAADDWPQWMGPNRDAVWTETGIVDALPPGGPKVLWRVPLGGGYTGPAVVGNRVFVADYLAKDDPRKIARGGPADFKPADLAGVERVLCLRADTGELLWKHEYDCPYKISYPDGPRCTPAVCDGKVYALGAMGHLFCLDAATGSVIWSKDFAKDYAAKAPLFGYSGHPLVVGNKLVCTVGGDGTTAVAFDKDTGKELWRALSAREIGYAPPTLIEAGGAKQLLIWHGEGLAALDPETGKRYWSVKLAAWTGVVVMAPRKDGDYLFAGTVFGTAVAVKLAADKPAATEVWRGPGRKAQTYGLFPMNMTPFAEGGVLYGLDQPGQFRAVKIATGERLWESWRPLTGKEESAPVFGGTAFVVKNGGRFFLFTEKGELVIAKLSPAGYEEVSRWKVLEPTGAYAGRPVVWSHPAFANRCVYARNDKELICASLAKLCGVGLPLSAPPSRWN
jgi:outer membrane protein assembly factor BamB